MQTLQDAARDKTAEAFTAHLTLIVNDAQAWVNLSTEDAVVEFPYAAALCSLKRLKGKTAIYNRIKEALAQMQNLIFTNVRTYQTLNPNV